MYSLGIILSAFFGMLLYFIAQKRGLHKIFWMFMGFIFGIFAVPFVFFAKPRPRMERAPERDYEGGGSIPEAQFPDEDEGPVGERKDF